MPEYFGILAQIDSEIQTEKDTLCYTKTISHDIPLLVDLLFKISYFIEKIDTSKVTVKSYCNDFYVLAPYTFKCLYDNFTKGYYSESLILIRHLLENFVCMRYFYKHGDMLEEYLKNGKYINEDKKKVNLTYSIMFKEFDSLIYENDYRHLSKSTHGKSAHSIFRTASPEHTRFLLGNQLNKDYIHYVLFNIILLVYGYLNYFEVFFPKNDLSNNQQIYSWYTQTLEGMQALMLWHQENNPSVKEWYDLFNKLIQR